MNYESSSCKRNFAVTQSAGTMLSERMETEAGIAVEENMAANTSSLNTRGKRKSVYDYSLSYQYKTNENHYKAGKKINTPNNSNFNHVDVKHKCRPDNLNFNLPKKMINNISLSQLSSLSQKHSNEILLIILDKKSGFLSLLNESDVKPNFLEYLIIVLGKAVSSNMSANVNNFMQAIECDSILLHMQRYLVLLQKLKALEKNQLDSIMLLTVFLEKFHCIMPSSSSDFISILLPLLISTCEKCLRVHQDLYLLVSEKLKEISEMNQHFLKQHTVFEMRIVSEKEKMHLQEPPESFRSLAVLPTLEDVNLPCAFLRPNIVKGKYKNTEHYLDVQYRLLREDYIKPLRDGISEYLNLQKRGESFKNCKDVRVYSNVCVDNDMFVNGDLLHNLKFSDKGFSKIQWERSKRFLTNSLLCLTLDDFKTMLFASVIKRDPEELKKGLLCIRFEEITEEVLNLNKSMEFVVIETTAYFEAYRHNLMALLQLNDNSLPLKSYIIDVEKKVSAPQYLQPATTFDMRPLFLSLDENHILMKNGRAQYEFSVNISNTAKHVKVLEESCWPTAAELSLDSSQFLALKAAVTKELAIIQGPPGTGKTYIGLRIVQLLLHNLDVWFSDETNSLPILIVCYTNHALDQFLEGLLLFTQKVVRVGGRSTNENILKYQLSNLRTKTFQSKSFPRYIWSNLCEANEMLKNIKKKLSAIKIVIEKSKKYVLTEFDLRKHMPPLHFETLTNGYEIQDNKFNVYDWLGISLNSVCKKRRNRNIKHLKDSFEKNEKYESEDEADIEYIENQRNVDFYEYKDFSFENISEENSEESSDETEWKIQQSNKHCSEMYKYVQDYLNNYEAMPEEVALQVMHVWDLNFENRWRLYKFWLCNFIREKSQESFELQGLLKVKFQEVSEMKTEEDLFLLKKANIVGMTTNGAAKYRHLVQELNPMILIVEEAAELLESHIVTSLASNTQHVILIGDQQQLRPSPTVHMLAVKYDLNISLFERMILNEVEYCKLSIQHRMRPEIAALIVPHIYSNLENHEIVTKFENLKGVNKNVFFVSHCINESSESDSKSKVNAYEAKFLVQLCRYLILQGYDPSQITVLTTYSGQLFTLKNLAKDSIFKDVRFTVVDNFQGEENDIILISFVRSNDDGVIGFLKVPNRVCVALSRARKGLFCIGNFDLLAEKSKLWENIVNTLNSKQSIGPSLRLMCQNHPNTYCEVASDGDFKRVPEGGCNQKCENRLPCGHACLLMCHPYDQGHEKIICKKPCTKICERGHPCKQQCFEKCYCKVYVDKTLSKCGHIVKDFCGKSEEDVKCKEPCIKTCERNHQCKKKCFKDCYCEVLVDKTLTKCGHTVNELCGKSVDRIKCSLECNQILRCTHKCPKKCGEKCVKRCEELCLKTCKNGHKCQRKCFEDCGPSNILVDKTLKQSGHIVKNPYWRNIYSIVCSFMCDKLLRCTHKCSKKCGETCETRCKKSCLKTCEKGHLCEKKCFEICDCRVMVDKTMENCGHSVKVPCGKIREETVCSFKCERKLNCGHFCINRCGEACVDTCMQLKETVSPLCGHLVKVQCYISNSSETLLKECKRELFKICSEQCKEVLPCGHKCSGTCGACYQKRLHVPCNEACERILICGHVCRSTCSKSCPPCQSPCENKCIHSNCHKKCCEPCRKCTKSCEWSCYHKKCKQRCYEICNREPCDEPCREILPCSHPCIGFCGEPCPKICKVCDNKTEDSIFYKLKDTAKFILLEDCGHVFEIHGFNQWMIILSEGNKIRMKTCPLCKTVIRKNLRYNKVIKDCLLQIDVIKKICMYNEKKNEELQKILFHKSVSLTSFSYFTPYNNLRRRLSSNPTLYMEELINIENVISIFKDLKLPDMKYISCKTEVIQRFFEYVNITGKWMTNFILKKFLSVSEHQLLQLTYEVHRVRWISRLLEFAETKYLESLHLEFENCSQYLLNYAPFNEGTKQAFECAFQVLISKLDGDIEALFKPIKFPCLKAMDMSANHWYKCPDGHVYCIINYEVNIENNCYECTKKKNDEQLFNRHRQIEKSETEKSNLFSHYLSVTHHTDSKSRIMCEQTETTRRINQPKKKSWNESTSGCSSQNNTYSVSLNMTGRMNKLVSRYCHPTTSVRKHLHRETPQLNSFSNQLTYSTEAMDRRPVSNSAIGHSRMGSRQNDFQLSYSKSSSAYSGKPTSIISACSLPSAINKNDFRTSDSRPANAYAGQATNTLSARSRQSAPFGKGFHRSHSKPSSLYPETLHDSFAHMNMRAMRHIPQNFDLAKTLTTSQPGNLTSREFQS